MKALITGGTSGIGKEIANILDEKGYELLIVGSRSNYDVSQYKKASYIACDLVCQSEIKKLIEIIDNDNFDIFIDNAGFGYFGSFLTTDDEKEIKMIDLNCKAMQILLKAMLRKMYEKNSGKILVTSSIAAYASAPYMSTYYATKAYEYRLVRGYQQELKLMKSKVSISLLCPGPVATSFEKTANCDFSMKPQSPKYIAAIAVKNLLKNKKVILPSVKIKMLAFLSKIAPENIVLITTTKSAKKRGK